MIYEETTTTGVHVYDLGASSGIGAMIARKFAELGCSLALTGRDAERLEKTRQECTTAKCTSSGGNKTTCVLPDANEVILLSFVVSPRVGPFGFSEDNRFCEL